MSLGTDVPPRGQCGPRAGLGLLDPDLRKRGPNRLTWLACRGRGSARAQCRQARVGDARVGGVLDLVGDSQRPLSLRGPC